MVIAHEISHMWFGNLVTMVITDGQLSFFRMSCAQYFRKASSMNGRFGFVCMSQEWWTSLWLKEGFATFMAMMAVEDFAPEFDVGASRPADILVPALNVRPPPVG